VLGSHWVSAHVVRYAINEWGVTQSVHKGTEVWDCSRDKDGPLTQKRRNQLVAQAFEHAMAEAQRPTIQRTGWPASGTSAGGEVAMTLDDGIAEAIATAAWPTTSEEQVRRHEQLAEWLCEFKTLRAERDELRAAVIDLFEALDYTLSPSWRDTTLGQGADGDAVNRAWDRLHELAEVGRG